MPCKKKYREWSNTFFSILYEVEFVKRKKKYRVYLCLKKNKKKEMFVYVKGKEKKKKKSEKDEKKEEKKVFEFMRNKVCM